MENARFLECLEADYRRMREIVPGHLAGAGAQLSGLDRRRPDVACGEVYLHKVETMRQGAHPEGWPPAFRMTSPWVAYPGVPGAAGEFAARNPADPSGTWYGPDQTVGFWIRRMAQETVIHRIDAELGVGRTGHPGPR